MDNKTVLAIVLSLAVLIGFQLLFQPPQPELVPQPPVVEKKAESPESVVVPVTPGTVSVADREITVENSLYSAVLSSRGGTIKSWSIKAYKNDKNEDVVLLERPGTVPALSIGGTDSFELANANFAVTGDDLKLNGGKESGRIIFEYSGEGISVRRTYTFHSDTYKVDVTDEVNGLPQYWITLGSGFGIFQSAEESGTHVGPILLTGTTLEELKPKDLSETNTFRQDLKWIAQQDKYFFSALVPATAVEEARAWTYKDSPVIAFKSNEKVNNFVLYAGPKEHKRLNNLNIGLEHIVDFGFFSIIARPLFWILIFFYDFIGNYGWAIVMLTIVTRIPFIPLLNKGQKSMRKLQELQPKMAEIKEKYKKDPPKMQKEMTELYKKNKVNPVGGCLPMLLQIPVFFALYKVLLVAIELRGAPFIFWVTDLSMKDPYYVLPIIMGLTMFIQQKMTPSTMDPKQAKIMMFLPLIFTFMFLGFASGLVLYWLVNNILSIIQQFFVNKKLSKKQPAS
jgi:YidC/Oxa1 family membrane protein insertase